MGNRFSWCFQRLNSSEHELQMTIYRRYSTKSELFDTIRLNENYLLAVGNELGTLHLYNLSVEDKAPQHTRYLDFTSGGISDMVWISDDILAVGTTRGNVVVFSLHTAKNHFVEICNVKAHGDGAARIPVESLDYCKSSRRLVTVGEGVGSIRFWSVLSTGALIPVELSSVSTAYTIPNFVSFINKGSKVLVSFSQNARVDRLSVDPFTLLDSFVLDEDADQQQHQRISSALWLESADQLVVMNPIEGLRTYNASSLFQRKNDEPLFAEDECRWQLTSLKGGSYFAIAGKNGLVQILQSQDPTNALRLKVPGRKSIIQAIHASRSKDGFELFAAASYSDKEPTTITVWCDQGRRIGGSAKKGAPDSSTFRVVILCALVSLLCHFLVSTITALDQQFISSLASIRETKATTSSPLVTRSDSPNPILPKIESPAELNPSSRSDPAIVVPSDLIVYL